MERVLRAIVLTVLLGLSAAPAFADAPQHLIPIDTGLNIFASMGMRPYYLTLRETLLSKYPLGAYVLVTPSFEPEWAIQVMPDDGGYLVRYARIDGQLWGTMHERSEKDRVSQEEALKKLRMPVVSAAAPLTLATGDAVVTAWSAMLAAAREPTDHPRIIDGTSYLFFVEGQPRLGMARSSKEGTPVRVLEDLVEALGFYAEEWLESRQMRTKAEANIVRLSEDVLRRAK